MKKMEGMPDFTEDDVRLGMITCKIWTIALKKHLKLREEERDEWCRDLLAAKFMRFVSKVWNALNEKEPGQFFKMPVIHTGARFGRRVGLPFGSPENPLCDVDAIRAFVCNPGKNKAMEFKYEKEEGDPLARRLFVKPLYDDRDAYSLISLGKLSKQGYEYLQNLCKITANLSNDEILAVGRHENPDQVRTDINHEAQLLVKYAQDLFEEFSKPKLSIKEIRNLAREMNECGTEMKKKSYSDKPQYESALTKITDIGRKYPDLVKMIISNQFSADKIWGDPHVEVLKFIAFLCNSFTEVIRQVIENYVVPCYDDSAIPLVDIKRYGDSYDDLITLLTIDPEIPPGTFGYNALIKLKSEGKSPIVSMRKVNSKLNTAESLNNFVQEAEKIFEFISTKYLMPKCFVEPRVREISPQLSFIFRRK